MSDALLGIDLALMLLLLFVGWSRMFSLLASATLFGFLHDIQGLHELNAIAMSVVAFFFLAGVLLASNDTLKKNPWL